MEDLATPTLPFLIDSEEDATRLLRVRLKVETANARLAYAHAIEVENRLRVVEASLDQALALIRRIASDASDAFAFGRKTIDVSLAAQARALANS